MDVVSGVGSATGSAVVSVAGIDVGTAVEEADVVVSGGSSLVLAAAGATSASPIPTATTRLAARLVLLRGPKIPRESRWSLRFSINWSPDSL
jgi:hypothetical protein